MSQPAFKPVPRLDLAPKLNRQLSLRNPLDYLRLLYWAFFFPQAIRWYMEKHGNPVHRSEGGLRGMVRMLRDAPSCQTLVLQTMILLISGATGTAFILEITGALYGWQDVLLGVLFGTFFGLLLSLMYVLMLGAAEEIDVRIARGIAGALTGGLGIGSVTMALNSMNVAVIERSSWSVVNALIFGVVFGLMVGAITSVKGGWLQDVGFAMLVCVISGMVVGTTYGISRSLVFGVTAGFICGIGGVIAVLRPMDWLLTWGLSVQTRNRIRVNHMAWLPLPGLQEQLELGLEQDWAGGTENVKLLLEYSLQSIPAVKALNSALANSPKDLLLARVSILVNRPHDWDLLRVCSARQHNPLLTDTQMNSAARVACAGFWLWHRKRIDLAVEAFAVVQNLRYGLELHGIAHAIATAQTAGDLDAVMAFVSASAWLEALPDPELRPDTLEVLRLLRQVADDARVARNSVSALSRSAALGRANAALTRLIKTGGETCPEPEWPLIKNVAEQWRDIISKEGGVVGEEVLRQPVPNPYEGYSGLPVTGPTFVGREKILRHIEDRWAGGAQPPLLILFGHRRMGKSSILRNLGRIAGANTIVVNLDMQDAGWVSHTGELLLDFAEAIQRKASEAGLGAIPKPDKIAYADLDAARRSFNVLLDQLDGRMSGRRLILAVDEYELIEKGIGDNRIDPALPSYLRSKMSQYRWLALIFAGLHTLDEMGHDYRSAFYGAAEHIRVDYLSHDEAIRLITHPLPDFALEYELELREELYRLTYGQPYLLQRLCWELVTRWNERFLKERESTPRILTTDDLAPALIPDFYAAAEYYFDGVWKNVSETERQLMRVMAGRVEGNWTAPDLAAAAGVSEEVVRSGLTLLRGHDVIVKEPGGIRYAAELMRRWVAMYQATPSQQETAK